MLNLHENSMQYCTVDLSCNCIQCFGEHCRASCAGAYRPGIASGVVKGA